MGALNDGLAACPTGICAFCCKSVNKSRHLQVCRMSFHRDYRAWPFRTRISCGR